MEYYGIYKTISGYNVVKINTDYITSFDVSFLAQFESFIGQNRYSTNNGNWGSVYYAYKINSSANGLVPFCLDINGLKTELQFRSYADWFDASAKVLKLQVSDIAGEKKVFSCLNSIEDVVKKMEEISKQFTWENLESIGLLEDFKKKNELLSGEINKIKLEISELQVKNKENEMLIEENKFLKAKIDSTLNSLLVSQKTKDSKSIFSKIFDYFKK